MIGRLMLIIFCVLSISASYGQSREKKPKVKKKDVLFTVNKKPVLTEEFIYLYNKNHQAKPGEYTREDILEYLDLFINFKLKVAEAMHNGMDTTAAFVKEYNSYRGELLKPYLPDSRIIDSLVTLTYKRLQEEVRASHILIGVKPEAAPADTLAAYNKIMELKKRIDAGEDFAKLAQEHSEDPSASVNHGDLGFFTAMQMVYPFETAAYTTPEGQVGDPVRTQFGYHLIKVTGRQPARGEVEVSHIMIRTGKDNSEEEAKSTIFNVYDQLMAGASWDELCRQYSEDQSSKDNGGRLRPFGVGTMRSVPEFERMAFAMQAAGDMSDPFKTSFGWHIMRLEKKTGLPPLEELAPQLKGRVAKDERLKVSREAWQARLRKEYQFVENKEVKARVMALADSSLAKGTWKAPDFPHAEKERLFSLQGDDYHVKDFLAYAAKNQRPGLKPETALEHLYTDYVDAKIMALVEEEIAGENPGFRMLLNEYYEGILLFEIMEDEVWNRASADTAGLRRFFDRNRAQYHAGERARADFYSASTGAFRAPLQKLIAQQDTAAIAKYVANNALKHEEGVYEKGDKAVLSQVTWAAGIYSAENSGMYYLAWIHEILPPGPKTFEEARAAAIADYQQELERLWVAELKKKYPVKLNEKSKQYVLDKLEK